MAATDYPEVAITFPRFRELLPPVYQGLLGRGEATIRPNQEDNRLELDKPLPSSVRAAEALLRIRAGTTDLRLGEAGGC